MNCPHLLVAEASGDIKTFEEDVAYIFGFWSGMDATKHPQTLQGYGDDVITNRQLIEAIVNYCRNNPTADFGDAVSGLYDGLEQVKKKRK